MSKQIIKIKEYKDWIATREKSKDEYGEKLCYCGHTYKCTCADPDFNLFTESVNNRTIKINDPDNGWENLKE